MKKKIVLFLIVGIGLLGYGLYGAGKQWRFYQHGIVTTGVITGVTQQAAGTYKLIKHPMTKGSQEYYPIIAFQTQDNKQITFIGQESAHSPDDFQLRTEIDVIYLPQTPQLAEVNNKKYIFLLLPVAAIIVGIFVLVLARSMFNRYKLQRLLKSNGKKIIAQFVGFKTSKEVQNNVQGMILVCQYKFMSNQPPVKFFSDPIFKKNLVIKQKKIPVYIDSTDKRKYYVDIEGVYGSDS